MTTGLNLSRVLFMTRVSYLYPSFARGEASPLVWGRIDIEQYPTLLAKCRNCFIRPYGVISRVPGTEYINETKNNGYVRLLRFVFSPTDAYIIELGAGYFRFYNNGAIVLKSSADDWETGKEYKKGGYVKESNIFYFCQEDHTSSVFADDLASGKWIAQDIYEVPNSFTEAQLDSIQYVQLDDILKFSCLPDGDYSTARQVELIRHAPDDWEFREVEFKSTPYLDENITDTTLTPSGTTGNITITSSTPVFNEKHVGSFWWLGTTVTENEEEIQGFVKITGFNSETSVTAEVKSKLSGTGATKLWAEGAWSDYRGYPAVIGLFDGRLYYARTPHKPRNIYGSKPYSYETFTPAVDNEDDGAINIELATNATGDGSDIKWLIGASALICGTYGGEFVIRGTGDGAITPSDVSARQRTNWGGEPIQPIVAGSFVHFIQRCAQKLRQFQYDYTYDTYKAVDVSVFSEHLLRPGIKDIAYQKNTDSIIYLLRKDGKVPILTFEQEQLILGWGLIEFKGICESIETIPSYDGFYDEVWYAIKRNINGVEKRYIERSQNPITPEIQQDCWYVRSGLCYNAYTLTAGNNITLSDVSGPITVTAQKDVFEASMVNKRIRVIDKDANILGQAKITEFINTTTVKAVVIKEFQNTLNEGGTWGISINEVSGLKHLENEEVEILADGAEQTKQTVHNGEIRLELDAWKIIAGLGYRSYAATLPLEVGSQNGTAVGKRKRINELSLRVWRTLGCRVGSSLNEKDLYNVKFRNPQIELGTPEPMFTGIIPNIKYNQGWEWSANIIVEQSKPFPMNILAIAPIVTEVDK